MTDPAPILTAAEVRAATVRYMDLDAATYPDADIEALVAEFEEVFTDYRGVAPTPREITEVVTVPSVSSKLVLSWPVVSAVDSITVNAVELDADLYEFDGPTGVITYQGAFSSLYPASVVYTHGLAAVPAALSRACARYVASVLKSEESGTSRDVLSSNFDGGTTRYSTPDKAAGRPTGWLEVDRLLNSLTNYKVPGVA